MNRRSPASIENPFPTGATCACTEVTGYRASSRNWCTKSMLSHLLLALTLIRLICTSSISVCDGHPFLCDHRRSSSRPWSAHSTVSCCQREEQTSTRARGPVAVCDDHDRWSRGGCDDHDRCGPPPAELEALRTSLRKNWDAYEQFPTSPGETDAWPSVERDLRALDSELNRVMAAVGTPQRSTARSTSRASRESTPTSRCRAEIR